MYGFKISNKGTARLFKSSALETLTRTHFFVPVSLYYLIAAACIFYAWQTPGISMVRILYLFPLGMLSFSLVEYLIHRFIFHFNAEGDWEEKLKYQIHGVHHEYPRDKDRLAMPPVMSIVVAAVFLLIFYIPLGKYVWLFYPGFTSGYSTYLIIHYAIHRFRPPSNFLRYLWKHHSLHHYKSDESAFSVSFPVWDRLFGTMPPAHDRLNKSLTEKLPDYNS